MQNEFLRKLYFYERQRGEKKPSNKNIKQIFNSFFVAQSVLAVLVGNPSLAKKKQEDIIFGEPLYLKIFGKRNFIQILAITLLCDLCLKRGENLERNIDKDEIRYFAYFHIARIIWFDLVNQMSEAEIVRDIENNNINKIEISYEKAVRILESVLKKYRKKEKIFSIGHLFSRLEIENDINKKIRSI